MDIFKVMSLTGIIIGIVNGLYLWKANRDAPRKDMEHRLDAIDDKLDRDYSRLNSHARYLQGRGKFEEMATLALRALVDHSVNGNSLDDMRVLSRQMSEYSASLSRRAAEDLEDE
jgi:hypothetical protein